MPKALPDLLKWYGLHISPQPSESELLRIRNELASSSTRLPSTFSSQRRVRISLLKQYFSHQRAMSVFKDLLSLSNLSLDQGEILEGIVQAHPDWMVMLEGGNPLSRCHSNLATYILLTYGAKATASLYNAIHDNLEGSLRTIAHFGPLPALGESEPKRVQPLLLHPSFLSLVLKQSLMPLASYYNLLQHTSPLALYWPTLLLLQRGMPLQDLSPDSPLTSGFKRLYPNQPLPVVTLLLPPVGAADTSGTPVTVGAAGIGAGAPGTREVTLALNLEEGQGLLLALFLLLPNPEIVKVKRILLLGIEQEHDLRSLRSLLSLYDLQLELLDILGHKALTDYPDLLASDYPDPPVNRVIPSKEYVLDLATEIGMYRVQCDSLNFMRGVAKCCRLLGLKLDGVVRRIQRYRYD